MPRLGLQERPATSQAPGSVGRRALQEDLEKYRRELTGYCYRMLGSGFEAEDAVQETMLRAWRGMESFEGRSSLRSWLYRVATNVCYDLLRGRKRRARPMELGPASPPEERFLGPMLPEATWVTPLPDASAIDERGDPAEVAAARESVRLAFVSALQYLPPRQRAALVLCEVLRWEAAETAELLGTTTAAVNSALQRARARLAALPDQAHPEPLDPDRSALVASYVEAFSSYDIESLVTLLHEDAVMSMPPFAMWVKGAANIGRFMLEPGPSGCAGSVLLPTEANGCPAFGQYKPDPNGGHSPWSLTVVEVTRGRISALSFFLGPQHL